MKIKQILFTLYSHSKIQAVINKYDIDDNVFKSIYTTVISKFKEEAQAGLLTHS